MPEQLKGLKTIAARPIDCTSKMLNRFVDLVMQGGEVPRENLIRGVPMSEMLFFTGTNEKIVGVCALRHANANYHKHLFVKAGVPQMYNRYSVEACWTFVLPEYRGMGLWQMGLQARFDYLGNRPCHTVRRADNKFVAKNGEYVQVGRNFYADTSKDELRLLVYNHDPVLDLSKRLRYRAPTDGETDAIYHG